MSHRNALLALFDIEVEDAPVYRRRRQIATSVILAIIFIAGCSVLWPPPARSAEARLLWAFSDTTTTGREITEGYYSHAKILHREDGGPALFLVDADSIFTYEGAIDSLVGRMVGTALIEDLAFESAHEFAVVAVDTLRNESYPQGRASIPSPWSEPWRPDPGSPSTPALIVIPRVQ